MQKNKYPIQDNPFRDRNDFQLAVEQMLEPLTSSFSEDFARSDPDGLNAIYYPTLIIEAFFRPWWGLVPLLAGGGKSDIWQSYFKGLRNGTNPEHHEFWGTGHGWTEFSILGCALALIPDKVWHPLGNTEKKNLSSWVNQINQYSMHDNNFQFFRVLANVGLEKIGIEYDRTSMEESFKKIESYYLGDGWYSDGISERRDYYVSFAMHFYGLIYSRLMEAEDPVRSGQYRDRARLFARDFIHWFADDGSALPFGRSLTYKFAQAAFWSALVFAGVEAFPWGVIKGIIMRHLRWWMRHPIFNRGGTISIGYAYPNPIVSEVYTGAASSNWAMKIFLPLCFGSDHAFWQAPEEPLPKLDAISVQPHPRMVLCRDEKQDHIFALTAGQYAVGRVNHDSAKYSKFVYSNKFGFSVPRGSVGLPAGAYDSTLAVCERDDLFRVRRKCEEVRIDGVTIYSRWKPWDDVTIETWLTPALPWHVRVHKVFTERYLETAEGGFSIENPRRPQPDDEPWESYERGAVVAKFPWGISGIVNLAGHHTEHIVVAHAHTNVLLPQTVIPTLKSLLDPGTHWLVSAVIGDRSDQAYHTTWRTRPELATDVQGLTVRFQGATLLQINNSGGEEHQGRPGRIG